jgi:hypothetical protein
MSPKRFGTMTEFTDLMLAGRGELLVSGRVGDKPVVVKLDRQGRRVRAFGGGDGAVWFPSYESYCGTMVTGCEVGARMIRRKDRIYVLTSTNVRGKPTGFVFALRPEGVKDRGFGRRALRATSALVRRLNYVELTDMAITSGGRLILGGWGERENHSRFGFAAILDHRGALVERNGRPVLRMPVGMDNVTDIEVDPKGRLVVAGFGSREIDLGEDEEHSTYEARYLRIGRFR